MSFTFIAGIAGRDGVLPGGGINTTGANFLLVFRVFDTASPAPVDTYGNNWTLLGSWGNSSSGVVTAHYCDGATVGVSHGINSLNSYSAIHFLAFNRTAGTLSVGPSTGQQVSSSSSPAPGSITPTVSPSLIVSAIGLPASAGSITAPSGFASAISADGVSGVTYGVSASWLLQNPAAAINPAWALGSAITSAPMVAAFGVTAGGPTPPPPPPPPPPSGNSYLGAGRLTTTANDLPVSATIVLPAGTNTVIAWLAATAGSASNIGTPTLGGVAASSGLDGSGPNQATHRMVVFEFSSPVSGNTTFSTQLPLYGSVVGTWQAYSLQGAVGSRVGNLFTVSGASSTFSSGSRTVQAGGTLAVGGVHSYSASAVTVSSGTAGEIWNALDQYRVNGYRTDTGSVTFTGASTLGWALSGLEILPGNAPPPAPPGITTQPQNQTVAEPGSAQFSVAATGAAPLSYQWFKNGSAIAGATAATYNTGLTLLEDNGSEFYVVVSNSVDSVQSSSAVLTITPDAVLPVLEGSLSYTNLTPTSYTVTVPQGTDNLAYSGIDYSLDGGSVWSSLGNVLSFSVTGRTPSTTDQVRVRGRDVRGNLSTPVLSLAVPLPEGDDEVAPVLTGSITVTGLSHNSAVIESPVATDNVGVKDYQWRIGLGGTWTTIANGGRVAQVSGFTPGSTVVAYMRAVDAAGNPSAALQVNITFAAAPATYSATTGRCFLNTNTPHQVNKNVSYTLYFGGDVGEFEGCVMQEGQGVFSGVNGTMTVTSNLSGPAFMLMRDQDGGYYGEKLTFA